MAKTRLRYNNVFFVYLPYLNCLVVKVFLNKFILIGVLSLIIQYSYSQTFGRKSSWKKQRKEYLFGFGVSNFLGDLGGRDAIGTDYSIVDLETVLTRPSLMFGYRYKYTKNFAMRFQLQYVKVGGDDKLTKEPFRNNRNLNFVSNIYEASINFEYSFFHEKFGSRYNLRNTKKSRAKSSSSYSYVFAGISGFWFNPKTKYQGSLIALQPLGTEGQGLIPGKKKYSRFSVCIPIGFGYKKSISKHIALGFEFNFRSTFTDYIDDVSTLYYDNSLIAASHGPIAAAVADPNLGNFPLQLDLSGNSKNGIKRGDSKNMDSYMSLMATCGYFFPAKKGRKRISSKF